jgi:hypothetical protein
MNSKKKVMAAVGLVLVAFLVLIPTAFCLAGGSLGASILVGEPIDDDFDMVKP